jgi:hypothetical protein
MQSTLRHSISRKLQGKELLLSGSRAWTPQSLEYKAIYNSYTVKPPKYERDLQDHLIKRIVDCGAWATFDIFYLFSTTSEVDCIRNLKNPGHFDGEIVNLPHVEYQGLDGNGRGYIRTHYNMRTDSVHYTLNSGSVGAGSYKRIGGSGVLNETLVGANDGTNWFELSAKWGDGTALFTLNNTVANLASVANDTRTANWCATRRANNLTKLYKNKVEKGSSIAPSSALANAEVFVLARGTSGTANYKSNDTVEYFFIGGELTKAQSDEISDAMDEYRAALIKVPNYTVTEQTKHIECINGNYQFAFDLTNLYYSSDAGATWYTKAWSQSFTSNAVFNLVEHGVLFENGNLFFTQLNKCYKSTDGLHTVTEVTVKDIDGSDYTGATLATRYYGPLSKIDIYKLGGIEMCVWGNYVNDAIAPDCPVQLYRMFNDCVPKIVYKFGVNALYPTVGDATNPVICRHYHTTVYDVVNNKWIVDVGDIPTQTPKAAHVLVGTYDSNTDTFSWTIDDTNSFIYSVLPYMVYGRSCLGLGIANGYLYTNTDVSDTYDYFARMKVGDENNINGVARLALMSTAGGPLCIQSNNVGIAGCVESGGYIYITQNGFRNIRQIRLTGYSQWATKIYNVGLNKYMISKYTQDANKWSAKTWIVEILPT